MSPVAVVPADALAMERWNEVADRWAAAVRGGLDRERAVAGEAMVKLVRQVPSGPILDAGCGEGWLARTLAEHGHRVTAFDGSAAMVELAKAANPARAGDYRRLAFAEASSGPRRMGSAFGTVVFNFSLLQERITPVLAAAAKVLFPYGRILIQAAHPSAAGDAYRDGWRTLAEAAPGVPFPRTVPWYFRTFTTWVRELRMAGLILVETCEPLDPDTGRPVSLILSTTIPERRRPGAM